jgi:2-keto-3-deoxy-L-rhamnonate aldolase RhmA
MIENSILKRNGEGFKALVFAMTFYNQTLIEMAAHVGFQAISLDGEHGAFTPESVDEICRVANGYNMSVVARVQNKEPNTINLWLDRGIQGVVGPHVETGEEAQALADACLFPPDGWRSWGGGRGTELNDDKVLTEKYGGKLGFAKWSNANMIVSAQIESETAYKNLDDILAVKGLSGIVGGPHDFSASLGFPGQPDHPERVKRTEDAEARAKAAGKSDGRAITLGIQDLMMGHVRAFAEEHSVIPYTGD